MHGAGGGAPIANRNALKHGRFTCEAIVMRREAAKLVREARRLVNVIR
jgi:glucans biosynthesis protein